MNQRLLCLFFSIEPRSGLDSDCDIARASAGVEAESGARPPANRLGPVQRRRGIVPRRVPDREPTLWQAAVPSRSFCSSGFRNATRSRATLCSEIRGRMGAAAPAAVCMYTANDRIASPEWKLIARGRLLRKTDNGNCVFIAGTLVYVPSCFRKL